MNTPEEFDSTTISSQLSTTVAARRSRRSLLRGAAIGAVSVTGVAVAGAGLFSAMPRTNAHAAAPATCDDPVQTILNIAATAEQLAVTFYTEGIKHAATLGITGQNLAYLQGAIVEEQIHQKFLVKNGAMPLTGTFSFPSANQTFQDQTTFINTLDMLETAFESAYLAAVKEFADQNQTGLAQVAAQICTIEAEHRALGRSISTKIPLANNWAFTPVLVKNVSDAVTALTNEGFLSPVPGNSFTYAEVSTVNYMVIRRVPFAKPC